MTSNNAKQAVRAIMADNPGMKYTEALRLYDRAKVSKHHYDGHLDPLSIAVKIELLKAWHTEHGSIDLPDSATITSDGQTFRAGEWLAKTRSQRRSGELDQWIVDELDDLEIDWGASAAESDADTLSIGDKPDTGRQVRIRPLRNTFIVGSTGSGKSVCIQALIRNAVDAGYEVTAIDPVHPGELTDLADQISTSNGLDAVADALQAYIDDEPEDGVRRRLLVVEELPHLIRSDSLMSSGQDQAARERISSHLHTLETRCPRTGVVVTTQRASVVPYRHLTFFDNRLLFGVASSQERECLLGGDRGIPSVTRDHPKGTAVISVDGWHTRVRPRMD